MVTVPISPHPTTARRPLADPPGGLLMWLVVVLELMTFALAFVLLAMFRAAEPAAFAQGQATLDVRFGLALTLILLASGGLVAEAVHAHRRGRDDRARRLYWGGICLGAVFLLLKVYDYSAKGDAGLGMRDDFGSAYFLSTGFHALHVLFGLVMLVYVASRIGRKQFEDAETAVAGTALFWHMCDVAWLFLFPLFYVR